MINVSNVLDKALSIIGRETIIARNFVGKTTTDYGVVRMNYTSWATYVGAVQPGIISSFGGKNVGEVDYKEMGLDWSKEYYTVWTNADVHTIAGREGTDQIMWKGKLLNVIQCADWKGLNGWRRCFCSVDMDGITGAEEEGGSSS